MALGCIPVVFEHQDATCLVVVQLRANLPETSRNGGCVFLKQL